MLQEGTQQVRQKFHIFTIEAHKQQVSYNKAEIAFLLGKKGLIAKIC